MAVPIRNYPDYLIHEDGRIWSNKTHKYLKPNSNKQGYESVVLFNSDGSRRILVHRLVADAFIPNPVGLPQVNHKDENPHNNNVDNLEWCTAKYNMNYGNGAKTRHLRIDYSKPSYRENAIKNGQKVSRQVSMLSHDGNCIASFASIVEASKQTGIYKTNIARSAKSDHLKAGGYKWIYTKGE